MIALAHIAAVLLALALGGFVGSWITWAIMRTKAELAALDSGHHGGAPEGAWLGDRALGIPPSPQPWPAPIYFERPSDDRPPSRTV